MSKRRTKKMKETRHPAYGYAELHEILVNAPTFLFGSDVPNTRVFELSIYEGAIIDDGKKKRYHAMDEGEPIVTVELSELQLMELLLSKNSIGVPVTLLQKGTERIAPLPQPQTAEDRSAATYEDSCNESIEACNQAMRIIQAASNERRNLKAAERESILRLVGFAKTQMEAGKDASLRRYRAEMEKIRAELLPQGGKKEE
jgi:hypothetical protein